MTAIGFYHLTRTGPDGALPALLGRTLAARERAVVLCGGPERMAALDAALWLCEQPDWLPHGTEGSPHPALQPIWLTATDPGEAAPNGARYLFLLDGARAARPEAWERVFDLFDGTSPEAVAEARRRWSEAKAAGHGLTYWQQGERGWERRA